MGTSQISCNCNKTYNESPYEYELQNGGYLRSKSGNLRIKTELTYFFYTNVCNVDFNRINNSFICKNDF